MPSNQIISVTPGQTSAELPFQVEAVDNMRLNIIAPVEGVELTLLDPGGAVMLPPQDVSVSFLDGSTITPPLPGGVFITPTIASPAEGVWTLRMEFPAATQNTIILSTLYFESRYQVGIVPGSGEFKVGEIGSINMIVLDDGQPVLNLNPDITVQSPALDVVKRFVGKDDGDIINADARTDDGIYSGLYHFERAGNYTLTGQVSIGDVERTVTYVVKVTEPRIQQVDISGNIVRGPDNCIEGFNVNISAAEAQPALYVGNASLFGVNGQSARTNATMDVANVEQLSLDLLFTSNQVTGLVGVDGPYTVNVDILSYIDGVSLEMRQSAAYAFDDVVLSDFCIPPITINKKLSVTSALRDGFIDALEFSFPVVVRDAGEYQIAFKVVDSASQNVELFVFTQSMDHGENFVTGNVSSKLLQISDRPFSVIDILVIGENEVAQELAIGESDYFSRWQFYPNITGDLDADGDVDGADRGMLFTGFFNPIVKALEPGDRRDLNSSGFINIRDKVLLITYTCQKGVCPVNGPVVSESAVRKLDEKQLTDREMKKGKYGL